MKVTYSAGGIVLNKKGQVLVVNQNGNSWSLPKGHIERGETALEAATREIFEESGIKNLVFKKELGRYKRYRIGLNEADDVSEQKEISMFLFTTGESELKPQDKQNPEARWVDKDEVAKLLTHRKDKGFFLKCKEGI
ncbi:NUDIX domain-containing protein [Candidatus Woesearchaeota archaeon]|nr:NUDIX domain-containing protein [Candidatus Woesearchaeota archaeon]